MGMAEHVANVCAGEKGDQSDDGREGEEDGGADD